METTHKFSDFHSMPAFVAVQGKIYHYVWLSHEQSAMHWLLHDGFMLENIPHSNLALMLPSACAPAVRAAL